MRLAVRFLAVFCFYIGFFCSCALASNDLASEMLKNNKRVHEIISELLVVAEQRVAEGIRQGDEGLNKAVRDILNKENNVDVLTSMAIALRGYQFKSLAGTEEVFFVYVEAWDCAISRIEEIGSREALSNLLMMRGMPLHDGASSLKLSLAIQRLEDKEWKSKLQKSP